LENWGRSAMEVAEGDIVYFSTYSPDEIEYEWKKYLIIKHNSILAKE
jgi:chaperonin GroES